MQIEIDKLKDENAKSKSEIEKILNKHREME